MKCQRRNGCAAEQTILNQDVLIDENAEWKQKAGEGNVRVRRGGRGAGGEEGKCVGER